MGRRHLPLFLVVLWAWLPLAPPAAAQQACSVVRSFELQPEEISIGDAVAVSLVVDLPDDAEPPEPLVGTWGDFELLSGAWSEVETETTQGCRSFRWEGRVSVYRTGQAELPSRRLAPDVRTEARTVNVRSLVGEKEASGEAVELEDLKGQLSLVGDYRALWIALGAIGLLLVGALLAWWLQRRYGNRQAPPPPDPFEHVPPHQWVYAELQKLLEERLPEQGLIDEFHSRVSAILKRYLGGRYRVDLMERTTEELPRRLRQAGAPDAAVRDARSVLERCDVVKFAAERPGADACKSIVEEIYRIVDTTKPAERSVAEGGG